MKRILIAAALGALALPFAFAADAPKPPVKPEARTTAPVKKHPRGKKTVTKKTAPAATPSTPAAPNK